MEELVFQYLPVELSIKEPFGLLKREVDTVVVLARDNKGLWLLGEKSHFYPEGIVRMLGGGMDANEGNPLIAIQRELQEETGVEIDEDKLVPLIHAEIIGKLPANGIAKASVFVFYVQLPGSEVAADDISGFARYTDQELLALVQRYEQLPSDIVIRGDEPDATWADYGKVWGPIHKSAFERVKELGL